jgi:hypothetical protein
MHTENVVYMQGDPSRIFELAANTQDWPLILPHYREVKVLETSEDGSRKIVEMACVRNGFPVPGIPFPVRWRSVQLSERETRRIFFKHTFGVAVGMWVVWTITPDDWGRGVRVTIAHDLTYPFNALNGWFAQDLVGEGFVHAIAGRTLATIKEIVEREAHR